MICMGIANPGGETTDMSRMWVATYYVANRFGTMQPRELIYGTSLPKQEVERRVNIKLAQKREAGLSVYPRFDLEQELRA